MFECDLTSFEAYIILSPNMPVMDGELRFFSKENNYWYEFISKPHHGVSQVRQSNKDYKNLNQAISAAFEDNIIIRMEN